MCVTQDDNIIVVGYGYSNLDGITNKGAGDAIIIKFDKNGEVVWQKS